MILRPLPGTARQIIPAKFFAEWVKDAARLERVMHEVMQMTKLDPQSYRRHLRESDVWTVRPQPSSFISKIAPRFIR